jgi:hypothetical protein
MNEEVKKGKYKHFKGKFYEVIGVARDCDDISKKVVIYRALYDSEEFGQNQLWTRPLEDFTGFKELDGKKIKRFEYIE